MVYSAINQRTYTVRTRHRLYQYHCRRSRLLDWYSIPLLHRYCQTVLFYFIIGKSI